MLARRRECDASVRACVPTHAAARRGPNTPGLRARSAGGPCLATPMDTENCAMRCVRALRCSRYRFER